jgi:predicted unusual protein kinase regulating ubiquinone biosynthesis (AarF/ABC1/UbiB family)
MSEENANTQDKIATGKVQRSMKILQTGAKVGVNYVKHYTEKAIGLSPDRERLDRSNAGTIFQSLNELKGSALKVAQMLSMDQGILPEAYRSAFAPSQQNAQPLSGPLVIQAFQKNFGKHPMEIFDNFNLKATHAASIGQVHQAEWRGKKLAVKIQYPGIAESIKSDLKLIRPFALRLLGMQAVELDHYFEEVESKLIEETNYTLELQQGISIAKDCGHLEGLVFPEYYPEWSNDRILVMDWLDGISLAEFTRTNQDECLSQKIAQNLWDFYAYQLHVLKRFHADPHPGNFLILENGSLGILDFGCVKEISHDFYESFWALVCHKGPADEHFVDHMRKLQLLLPSDSPAVKQKLIDLYEHLISLFGKPYRESSFDFKEGNYMDQLYQTGMNLKDMEELKEARGNKDFIYVNRTHFGLYHLLQALGGKIKTEQSAFVV